MAGGTWRITLSNAPVRASRTMAKLASTNAPTASGQGTPGNESTSKAAPGVDHATETGILV